MDAVKNIKGRRSVNFLMPHLLYSSIVPVIIAAGKLSPSAKILPRAWRKALKDFSAIV